MINLIFLSPLEKLILSSPITGYVNSITLPIFDLYSYRLSITSGNNSFRYNGLNYNALRSIPIRLIHEADMSSIINSSEQII